MTAPRVSVVLTTCTDRRFVGEAISSVLAQTSAEFELIVVNDGSTDDTAEVVRRFADARIRYTAIPAGGLSVARNTGIDVARGDYLAFLDANDRYRPTMLERLLTLMDAEPDVSLCFSNLRCPSETRTLERTQFDLVPELRGMPARPARGGKGFVLLGDPFELLTTPRQSAVRVPTCLIRRAHLAEIRFPPCVRLCQDLVFVLTALSRFEHVAFIDEPLLDVRQPNGAVNQPEKASLPTLDAMRRVGRLPLRPRHRRALRRLQGQVLTTIGYDAWRTGRFGDMTWAYARALLHPGARWSALKHLALAPAWSLFRRRGQRHTAADVW